MLNLTLFIAQLNQATQSSTLTLANICELLQVHIDASITIKDANNISVVELLAAHDGQDTVVEHSKIAQGNMHLNEGFEKSVVTENFLSGDMLLGTFEIYKNGNTFCKQEMLAIGIAISMCAVIMRQNAAQLAIENEKRKIAVRNLINSLSFSELEAVTLIMKDMFVEGSEKYERIIIAGNVADRLGFARSVVTSALKKLEGASLVETRSLGMKGTYIRVNDVILLEEICKL